MGAEQRVIDRDYLLNKSVLYIGDKTDDIELIKIFEKAFNLFLQIENIDSIISELEKYDIIISKETDQSLSNLQKIRELDTRFIPFILIENENYQSNPIIYIKENLSQYIKLTPTHTEIMYIIQHELQSYDKYKENLQLQLEHKAYLEMLDNIVIVSRTDLKGVITYVNDIFCEVSKYSHDELIGSHHNIIRHPEHSPTLFKELWETIQNDNIWKGILKNRDKNGDTYITNTTIAPYYTNGEKTGYLGIRYLVTDDVIEKRNLKSHLRKLTIDTKKLVAKKNEEIELLKNKNKMIDSMEDALNIEKSKKFQLEVQIKKFEKKIKDAAHEHSKRVESYLQERREYAEVLQKKDREIKLLKEHIEEQQEKNNEYESSMLESGQETLQLKKRIKELEDIIKHQEEKLN